MKTPECCSVRQAIGLLCILFLVGCDGGISGSSNGGGSPAPANGIQIGYQIEHLPPTFAAALPDGLRQAEPGTTINPQSPVKTVSEKLREISNIYVDLSLLLLYTDAVWPTIDNHCRDSLKDEHCDLSSADLSFTYTRDMAVWESHARQKLTTDSNTNISSASEDIVLHTDASTKIGSVIEIASGTYKKLSAGEYDHEISMTLPGNHASGNTYQLLWDSEQSLVHTLAVSADSDTTTLFRSRFRTASQSGAEQQNIILEVDSNSVQNEYLLNLHKPAAASEVLLESHATTIEVTGKTDIYSRGKADDVGGYLYSEAHFEDSNSISDTHLHRELFGIDDTAYSSAVCDISESSDDCLDQQDWSLVQGTEPTSSDYYTPLGDLEAEHQSTEVTITNTRVDADSFIIIKRDNVSVTLTVTGLQVTVPVLGSLSWPLTFDNFLTQPKTDLNLEDTIIGLQDLICYIIPTRNLSTQTTRTFCTGTIEDIEDALVVSTSYVDGEYQIQWEANAKITIKE